VRGSNHQLRIHGVKDEAPSETPSRLGKMPMDVLEKIDACHPASAFSRAVSQVMTLTRNEWQRCVALF